jgi:hypothetical protein
VTEQVPTPTPGATPTPGGDPTPAAPKPPEGLPPQFWDATGGKVNLDALIKDYGEHAGFRKAHDEAKAALPKDPAGYKIALPENFKLPDGLELPEGFAPKIDEKDPRIPMLQALAVEEGLSPALVSKLAALDVAATAQVIAAHDKAEKARVAEEMKKIGDNADVRMKAAETFLKTTLGDEKAAALQSFMTDAVTFGAIEDLIARATRGVMPGGASPLPNNQAPPQSVTDRWYGNTQQKAG